MNRPEFNLYIRERQEGICDILESSNVVMEFFKLKDKEKDYTIAKINSEINSIKKDIKEIIDNNEDIKEFYNNGLKITSNKDTFEFADERDDEQYKSGCVFYIVDIDLNKYKKEKLKTRRDPHPIDEPQNKLEKMIMEKTMSKARKIKNTIEPICSSTCSRDDITRTAPTMSPSGFLIALQIAITFSPLSILPTNLPLLSSETRASS